jgi:membrane protein DedA with SNARE-associated domain
MYVPTDTAMLARHGALWMFLVTLGERLGLPVFISPLLLAAGAMVAVNPMQFWLVMLATAVPCLLGDAMWYELGRWKGRAVIAAMCRISFVPDSLEQKAYAGLDRFKGISLLYAKWIPGVAHLAPPVAGAARLPRAKFLIYNGIGSLVWILAMLLAGVVSMHTFDWMEMFTRSAKWSFGFLTACSVPLALYSWWRRKQAKARREAEERVQAEERSLPVTALLDSSPQK